IRDDLVTGVQTCALPILARREWIRDVGLLIEEARTGDPITLSRTAGQYGHNGITIFREARRRLSDLDPPPECEQLHQAIGEWIRSEERREGERGRAGCAG